jgi:hypothetical protein
MKRTLLLAALAAAVITLVPSMASATTISCGGVQRTLAVYNVTATCYFGNSANPNEALVGSTLGGVWTKEGTIDGSNGTNDLLTVTVTNSWGPDADGTFLINPSFWQTWGRGAISFHVGEGSGDPDWWIFELVNGFTGTGTFDLDRLSGGGGGLSNIVLYGSGQPTINLQCGDLAPCDTPTVPEPASLVLFGTGLAGMATVLRRKASRKA